MCRAASAEAIFQPSGPSPRGTAAAAVAVPITVPAAPMTKHASKVPANLSNIYSFVEHVERVRTGGGSEKSCKNGRSVTSLGVGGVCVRDRSTRPAGRSTSHRARDRAVLVFGPKARQSCAENHVDCCCISEAQRYVRSFHRLFHSSRVEGHYRVGCFAMKTAVSSFFRSPEYFLEVGVEQQQRHRQRHENLRGTWPGAGAGTGAVGGQVEKGSTTATAVLQRQHQTHREQQHEQQKWPPSKGRRKPAWRATTTFASQESAEQSTRRETRAEGRNRVDTIHCKTPKLHGKTGIRKQPGWRRGHTRKRLLLYHLSSPFTWFTVS